MELELRCPCCHSDEVLLWDDGYLCQDCGAEF